MIIIATRRACAVGCFCVVALMYFKGCAGDSSPSRWDDVKDIAVSLHGSTRHPPFSVEEKALVAYVIKRADASTRPLGDIEGYYWVWRLRGELWSSGPFGFADSPAGAAGVSIRVGIDEGGKSILVALNDLCLDAKYEPNTLHGFILSPEEMHFRQFAEREVEGVGGWD